MAVPPAYLAAVKAAAVKNNVPAALLAAQIQAESGWNPNAHSGAGADGISQFMPGTAKSWGLTNTKDPIASIAAQGRMMGSLLKAYHGNQDLALAAYNAGSNAVADAGGKVPQIKETQNYIKNIHGYMSNYPGLANTDASAGVSTAAVSRANDYAKIIAAANVSQTPSKPSLALPNGNVSNDPMGDSQGLLGYLINQSKPGQGTRDDATSGLLSVLQQSAAKDAAATGVIPTTTAPVVPSKVTSTVPVPKTADVKVTGPTPVVGLKGAKLIGLPNQGTHTLYGNWESDNAIDIAVPAKTPVYATEDGVVGSRIGHINTKDAHMAGQRVNLTGGDNSFYYQHLQTVTVKAGQHVKKGDLIGYSGAMNHVHFAVKNGDPRQYYK